MLEEESSRSWEGKDGPDDREQSADQNDMERREREEPFAYFSRVRNDDPWFMRILPAFDRYGIPALIAAGLVWWMATGYARALESIQRDLKHHMDETGFYLRAICLNVAVTRDDKLTCLPPEERYRDDPQRRD